MTDFLSKEDLKTAIEKRQRGPLDTTSGWQSKENGAGKSWKGSRKAAEMQKYENARKEFDQGDPDLNDREWKRAMWVWARRVRRDILALELQMQVLADNAELGEIPFFKDPGDPPPPPDEEDGLF